VGWDRRLGGEEHSLWAHLVERGDEHWTKERGISSSDTILLGLR